jgi:hypothetical protein
MASPIGQFRVGAWLGGSAFGRLVVRSGEIAFEPGSVTCGSFRLSGRLVHRDPRIVSASSVLGLGALTLVVRADEAEGQLVMRPLPAYSPYVIGFGNISLLPWQRTHVLRTVRGAGFTVDRRRVRLLPVPFWRPLG